jgi:hypothetical protein
MAEEQTPLKVHRIQTEDVNRDGVLALLDQAFEAYTVNLSLGRWKGKSEPSLTIEVTGTTYEAVSKVAEDIRSMNAQEAVLVSEYEPSKVNFLFRPVLAAFLGGFIVLGAISYQRSEEKQKYIEHMVFTEQQPPPAIKYDVVPDRKPQSQVVDSGHPKLVYPQISLSDIDTWSLVKELKKRLSAMDKGQRDQIRRLLAR